LEIGNSIEAYIVSMDNDEIILSKSLSGHATRFDDLISLMDNKVPVDGRVTGVNRGGFNVTVMGKKAFCPFSHIDLKYVNEPTGYLSKTYQFVITRVTNKGRDIVLSRLPLLEKDLVVQLDEIQKYCDEKKIMTGTITKIADFGLFVSINDFEGLVHISEISWDRTQNLEELYSVGQTISFVVLKIERKEPLRNSKISLSIRLTSQNPWETVSQKLFIGNLVHGKITRVIGSGAFIQLMPGIEGFIHVSEMSWIKRVHQPSDVVSVGQEVSVTILSIDTDKQTISCSIKDINANPWNTVTEKYPVGSKAMGKVANQAKYGYFIDLDDYFTGLLPNARIAKEKKGAIRKGEQIEVTIVEVDRENYRIGLSYGELVDMEIDADAMKKFEEEQKTSNAGKRPSTEFGALLKAAMTKKED